MDSQLDSSQPLLMTDDEAEASLNGLTKADAPRLRRQIAMNQLNERKRAMAVEWLAQEDRQESSQSTRSAKNAAWAAAIAATVAAIATGVTAYLAYVRPPL